MKNSYLNLRKKFFEIVKVKTPNWTKQDNYGLFLCFLAYIFNDYLETSQLAGTRDGKAVGIWRFVLKLAQADYQLMGKIDQ